MKSIIITGPQSVGKSNLARMLSFGKSTHETNIKGLEHIRDIHPNTEVIVIDEITEKDVPKFMKFISNSQLSFRPPYQSRNITISPIVIGVFESSCSAPTENIKDSSIFNLAYGRKLNWFQRFLKYLSI